jgi:hypothetical protein
MKPQSIPWLGSNKAPWLGSCTFALCVLLQLQPNARGEIPGLAIGEVQICQDVQDHQPINLLNDPDHRVRNKPVWVWLLLTGTEQSLEHLRSGKEIPVKTVWLYCGNEPTPKDEDGNSFDEQPMTLKELIARYPSPQRRALTLGRISKFDALRGQAEEEKLWGWRTASKKISLSPGFYRIYFYLTQGGRLNLPDGSEYLIFDYEP